MATLSRGQTFGSTETVTNTKLHNLVDLGSISNIVNADIDSSANIADTKLADITTGNKVHGRALGYLASIPSSGGVIPFVNIPVSTMGQSLTSIPASSLTFLASIAQNQGVFNYKSIVSSLASGSIIKFDGSSSFIGGTFSNSQKFTSNGTFNVPGGVSQVYITLLGGGGGGRGNAGAGAGYGGGGGGLLINYPVTVTPGGTVTVTIGAGGAGGVGNADGSDGGDTSFGSVVAPGGNGGTLSSGTGGGGIDNLAASTTVFSFKGGDSGTGAGPRAGSTPFGLGTANDDPPSDASDNTGAGGGGAVNATNNGAAGGSGLCIVMW